VRERTSVQTNVTFGYLLDEWIEGHEVEATTRAGYVSHIEKFIRPAPGDQTLGQLAQRCRPLEWLGVEHAIVLCAGLWAAAGLATLAAARPLLDRAERAG
jgi:hypothetical protein